MHFKLVRNRPLLPTVPGHGLIFAGGASFSKAPAFGWPADCPLLRRCSKMQLAIENLQWNLRTVSLDGPVRDLAAWSTIIAVSVAAIDCILIKRFYLEKSTLRQN